MIEQKLGDQSNLAFLKFLCNFFSSLPSLFPLSSANGIININPNKMLSGFSLARTCLGKSASGSAAMKSGFSTSATQMLMSGGRRGRRNSFSMSTESLNKNGNRFKSSSAPPSSSTPSVKPKSAGVPISTSLFEQTAAPKNVQARELALDMFFSGHRPLFMTDHTKHQINNNNHNSADKNSSNFDGREYMPWDVSVSGLELNPEMKNVPRVIVRNMLPFQPAPTEAEATKMEAERLQQRMEENAILAATGVGRNGVKVFSVEVNGNNNTNATNFFDNNNNNLNTEFSIVVDEELANHPDVSRSLNKIKSLLLGETDISEFLPRIVESPASKSFGRIIEATSVKRKRKLKMNKHKLRKRRKLQRALRRKLDK